jgi:hypothetical protein
MAVKICHWLSQESSPDRRRETVFCRLWPWQWTFPLGELLGRHPAGVYMTNDKFSMTNSQSFQSLKSSPRHNSSQESDMHPTREGIPAQA